MEVYSARQGDGRVDSIPLFVAVPEDRAEVWVHQVQGPDPVLRPTESLYT